MTIESLYSSSEFSALRDIAERLGQNPLQIQGPGGNVSLKADGLMLVKASGTWLEDANREDIFAPVDALAMRSALLHNQLAAEHPEDFLLSGTLRPSIETGFHALLEEPVVLHTHCVSTLACSTGALVASDLDRLGLVVVPYCKPGSDLAIEILNAWQPGTKGLVLQNHGLIVTGKTVREAWERLHEITEYFNRFSMPLDLPPDVGDVTLEQDLAETGWKALDTNATTTALAYRPDALKKAVANALFPDQVIFLGPQPFVADLSCLPHPDKTPLKLAFFPGRGAALPKDANAASTALARMVGEVVFRLPEQPTRLSLDDISELLGWDAEKYRQAMEEERTNRLNRRTV